jgi:threonine/homoserine/homoserine lactone efflux protein
MFSGRYPNAPRRGGSGLIFLVFLLVGLYFLNLAFHFITIPTALTNSPFYNNILNFITGALLIIGGFKFLFNRRNF